ncbi:trypsin CFT-1 [Helicoverpa armigera]|uniref:trypsin CFT-1 n=1 Tax=Helicoverpa armigera TaxID=29058 RepID=UPI00211259CB|nr:trypsin CFT-1 [Helicoverpa armigera]
MRFIIFFASLALLGSAFAVPRSASRIVGGSATDISAYPFMSNMQYHWWGIWWMQSCGGSLLTSTAVLSAAHCFYGDRASEWRVLLGSSLSNSGSLHLINSITLHPQYNHSSLNFDVAIVRLSNPAIYSNNVQPGSIAGSNYHVADGTSVTHVGWGALWYDGPASNQLMHVDINVINQQLCAERYAYLKTQPRYENWPDVTDNMMCAGILNVGGKDACSGDSGGPLLHNNVIVGITSWGFECADPFYPGVSARVSYFTNWITANA